ncbi:hypothetical protein [Yersinia pekkanenii]|uniref:Uncharacterized protein n=1 Tax=Yersinia pekkanenii TaxID=1288385 RepID=A0A0T9Q371_9GAMM|nr:hypothetical protein [Yersinia pekkanenii]CNH94113.1 Uncharacterised protein [Yersinia pekkanenii]CRY68515.1 Uncharacterised protein [Yersinia pekkanenii]
MKWNIISGNEAHFSNAPEWAIKLILVDGSTAWWDGQSKLIDSPVVVPPCLFEYEEEFKLIAERKAC